MPSHKQLGAAVARYCNAPSVAQEGMAPESLGGWELVQVQILVRHGLRSAIHAVPGVRTSFSCELSREIENKVGFWHHSFQVYGEGVPGGARSPLSREWRPATQDDGRTCQSGQLVDAGFRQLFELGVELRGVYTRHWGNLGDILPQELYARATDYQRTRASVAALLTGLLGLQLQGVSAWGSRRFPIHVRTDQVSEVMMGVGLQRAFRQVNNAASPRSESSPGGHGGGPEIPESPCPRSTRLAAMQAASFVPAHGLIAKLGQHLGEEALRNHSVVEIADALYSASCDGDSLPHGRRGRDCASDFAKLLDDADRRFCERYTGANGGAEATRLAFHPLLEEVLGRLRRAASSLAAGGGVQRLVVFGGHDTVVAPVAAALGFWDCKWPSLASHIIFELWKSSSSSYGVRVLFDGQVVTKRLAACAGMGEVCPLKQFVDAIASLLGGHASLQDACAV